YGDETCYECFGHYPMSDIYRGIYDAEPGELIESIAEAPSEDPSSYEFAYNLSLSNMEPEKSERITVQRVDSSERGSVTHGIPDHVTGGFAVTRGFEETGSSSINVPQMTPTPEPMGEDEQEMSSQGLPPAADYGISPAPPPTAAHRGSGGIPEPVDIPTHTLFIPQRFQCPVCQELLRAAKMRGSIISCGSCSYTFHPYAFVGIPPVLNTIADPDEREHYFEKLMELDREMDNNAIELCNLIINSLLDCNPSSDLLWLDKAAITFFRAIRNKFELEDMYDVIYYLDMAMKFPGDAEFRKERSRVLCTLILSAAQYIYKRGFEGTANEFVNATHLDVFNSKYKGIIKVFQVAVARFH
ncbi:hypothetical protein KJ865_06920, partial [Myxococcota bacterium]|nr:hypothetical protein [Myxococcota bacterium]